MNTLILLGILLTVIGATVLIGVKCYGTEAVREFCTSKIFKGCVAIVAAIIMYFTPDEIDYCIITALSLFGIPPLVMSSYTKEK